MLIAKAQYVVARKVVVDGAPGVFCERLAQIKADDDCAEYRGKRFDEKRLAFERNGHGVPP
jgi:hypothetical protein